MSLVSKKRKFKCWIAYYWRQYCFSHSIKKVQRFSNLKKHFGRNRLSILKTVWIMACNTKNNCCSIRSQSISKKWSKILVAIYSNACNLCLWIVLRKATAESTIIQPSHVKSTSIIILIKSKNMHGDKYIHSHESQQQMQQ